jgi:hypothetical protein
MAFPLYNDVKDLVLSASIEAGVPVSYDCQLSYSGSYGSGSYSGSIIYSEADNLISEANPCFSFHITSSNYIEYGTETSRSLAAVLDAYDGIEFGDYKLATQVVISNGNPSAQTCDLVNCYFGEALTPIIWQGVEYVSPGFSPTNRNIFRPLKGGITITSTTKSLPFSSPSVGTLGLICQDSASGALVGLTNNHVVIRDAFYTNQRDLTGVVQNEFDIYDGQTYIGQYPIGTIPQYQENGFQTSPEFQPVSLGNSIGRIIRYVPLYESASGQFNRVDGALIALKCTSSTGQTLIDFTSSFQQEGLNYTASMPFASTAEIDNLFNTNPALYSSGRTTGVKSGSCELRFAGFMNTPIVFKKQNQDTLVQMVDCIKFVKADGTWDPLTSGSNASVCPYPVWGGDSGSTLIANFGGTWKIIGLVFAGNGVRYNPNDGILFEQPSTYGLACRIDDVANELSIKAWTGSIAPVVDFTSIDYITVSGSNDIKTLECKSQTYWQVGLTKTHKPCS